MFPASAHLFDPFSPWCGTCATRCASMGERRIVHQKLQSSLSCSHSSRIAMTQFSPNGSRLRKALHALIRGRRRRLSLIVCRHRHFVCRLMRGRSKKIYRLRRAQFPQYFRTAVPLACRLQVSAKLRQFAKASEEKTCNAADVRPSDSQIEARSVIVLSSEEPVAVSALDAGKPFWVTAGAHLGR